MWSAFYSTFVIGIMVTFLGFFGVLTGRKNLISVLLAMELIYTGIILTILLVSVALSDFSGQIYALTIVILAAAESVLMLGLVIIYGRRRFDLCIDNLDILGG